MSTWWTCALLLAAGPPAGGAQGPEVAAEPAVIAEQIVVTAARAEQPLSEVGASVTLLGRDDVESSAARSADDLLRRVPGFSLFRRSSSLVAHPTTQGATLRGIAPSGAGRALVLVDGVPLNDPFGGWVAWSMVPLADVERIEVVRGGGSDVWGNAALGGVVHLLTRAPAAGSLAFTGELGERDEGRAQLSASETWQGLAATVGGEAFTTGGYPIIREDQRGAIDEDARSRHGTLYGRLDARLSPAASLRLRATLFDEDRGNGTPLTGNSTDAERLVAGASFLTDSRSEWRVDLTSDTRDFANTFSSQAADRDSERPALDQFDVGGEALGLGLQWSRRLRAVDEGVRGAARQVSAGVDLRAVEGATNEDFFWNGSSFNRRRRAGGEQELAGGFVQASFAPSARWQWVVGGRLDHWRSFDGTRTIENLSDGRLLEDSVFEDRSVSSLSPRLAAVFRAGDSLTVRGSLYRSFRVPTVNELFRPFRVRSDITAANAELEPERLTGAEASFTWRPAGGQADLETRLTGFWNEVDDPIANVTLGTGPGVVGPCGFVPGGGLCRQRDNLDRTRIRGLEAELGFAAGERWRFDLTTLWNDPEVVSAPEQPALQGKRLAQVPEHSATLRIRFRHPELLDATLEARYAGPQFEDDTNSRELGGFTVVNLALSRRLGSNWDLFLRVENVLDRTYDVGRTADGIVAIGAPRLVRAGFRFRAPGR